MAHSEEGDIDIGMATYHMPNITKGVHVFSFLPMYYKWIVDRLSNIREEVIVPAATASTNEIPSIIITMH